MYRVKMKDLVKDLKRNQQILMNSHDEYSIGLYNGIEYTLSVIEDREPDYRTVEEEKKDELKASKRTMSGRVTL